MHKRLATIRGAASVKDVICRNSSVADLLDIPFFCFHDADVAPEGATLAESKCIPPDEVYK